MSASDAAPHVALDPACTDKDGAHDHQDKHDAPRDSKGWDGKLRVDRRAQVVGADGTSDADESEDEGPQPEEIAADEDLLDDVDADEEEIELVHFRISSIPALRLERFNKVQVRNLRFKFVSITF